MKSKWLINKISILMAGVVTACSLFPTDFYCYAGAFSDKESVSANFGIGEETVSQNNYIQSEDEDAAELMASDKIDWESLFVFGGDGNTEIQEYTGAFSDVVIPAKATSIKAGAFNTKGIRIHSVTFEEGSKMKQIANGVFRGCPVLSRVVLPDSLEKIGDEAFRNTVITEITIPDNVTYIGSYAFANNRWLTTVSLGTGLKTIDQYAFANCDKLKTIRYNCEELGICGEHIFDGCILKNIEFSDKCVSIAPTLFSYATFTPENTIVLPDSIKYIGSKAFYKATNLAIAFTGKQLEYIDESAFQGSDIQNIGLPHGIKRLAGSAFRECTQLSSIILPSSVEYIEDKCFEGCTALSKVYIPKSAWVINENAFDKCRTGMTVYGSKSSYAERWVKKFGEKKQINFKYSFKIVYSMNGGVNNPDNPELYVPEEPVVFKDPVKKGFTFEGFYADSKFKKKITGTADVRGNIKVYAKWKAIKYSVTYVAGGSDVDNKKNEKRIVRTASKPYKIYAPKRKGYDFKGWYYDFEFKKPVGNSIPKSVTENVILYAKWKEYSYSVIFSTNGGTLTQKAGADGVLDSIVDISYTDSFEIPQSGIFESRTKEGYIYTGWNKKADGNINNTIGAHFDFGQTTRGLSKKKNAVVTLYAEWTPIEYNVIYELDDGANNKHNPDTHNVTKAVKLKKPVKPGCKFMGWYTEPSFENKISKIPKNYPFSMKLYAKWE